MAREEAKEYLINISYKLGSMSIEYLTEKDGEKMREAIYALEQEPCEDAIDRAEAMTEIMMFAGNAKADEEDIYIKVPDAVQLLRELPPVTPQQKMGKWKFVHPLQEDDEGAYECSCCKSGDFDISYHVKDYKFCPYCGAKMKEIEE